MSSHRHAFKADKKEHNLSNNLWCVTVMVGATGWGGQRCGADSPAENPALECYLLINRSNAGFPGGHSGWLEEQQEVITWSDWRKMTMCFSCSRLAMKLIQFKAEAASGLHAAAGPAENIRLLAMRHDQSLHNHRCACLEFRHGGAFLSLDDISNSQWNLKDQPNTSNYRIWCPWSQQRPPLAPRETTMTGATSSPDTLCLISSALSPPGTWGHLSET